MVYTIKRLFKNIKTQNKIGLPPGTLIHIGSQNIKEPKIEVINYNKDKIEKKEITHNLDECINCKDKSTISWINIIGINDKSIINQIGSYFDIHLLILEDIMNTEQRSKIEVFDDFIFVVLNMLQYDDENEELLTEQISFILGDTFVISFQEQEGDVFDPIRERLKNEIGNIRKKKADYLFYCLADTVVDNYFLICEIMEEKTDIVDEQLINNIPKEDILTEIQDLKQETMAVRKAVSPLRGVFNYLLGIKSPLIQNDNKIFFKDINDHVIRTLDEIEVLRDMLSTLMDIYLSRTSNKMNEVMQVLTIIATIFIPLTFIAGVYGMNFKYMPELETTWGYPVVLGIMGIIAIAMLFYFKGKKWL